MNAPARSYARQAIRPEMTVRQVAADFLNSHDVFSRYGEPERGNIRFGHLEPLTQFARRHGVPIDSLLAELSAATGAPADLGGQFAAEDVVSSRGDRGAMLMLRMCKTSQSRGGRRGPAETG